MIIFIMRTLEVVFTPQTITGTLTDFTIDLSFGATGVAADYVINNVGVTDHDGDGKRIVWLI